MTDKARTKKKSLGVLLLHGFTSSTDSVDNLIPLLEAEGVPYVRPILRGHGAEPTALLGVSYKEWIADAEAALGELLKRVNRVVAIGLSMGGLVAIEMGIRHPQEVVGIVGVAPAIRFSNPLAPLANFLKHLIRYFPSPNSFSDKAMQRQSANYPYFPVTAFASLYRLSTLVEGRLKDLKQPILILQHTRNQVTNPKGAEVIFSKVSSKDKHLRYFALSGHEMMQDVEKEPVLTEIMAFIHKMEPAS